MLRLFLMQVSNYLDSYVGVKLRYYNAFNSFGLKTRTIQDQLGFQEAQQ